MSRALAGTLHAAPLALVQALMLALMLLLALLLAAPVSAANLNVGDAGARGDGKTDCTAVFQKLLDQAGAAGGGIVDVPAGQFRIDGNLSIPGGVTLQGTFRAPPTSRHDPRATFHGSVLLAFAGRGKPDEAPFIRLNGNNATVAGLIIHYPEWKQTDVPPIPYPPCILGENYDNVAVLDTCLVNPWEGIRLVRAGRHLIRNVYGYPIKRGLYVDECYDIGRVENCHFWPFGVHYKADDPYCYWINTQGVAFEFARTDWQYVLNTFCFGYGIGYYFSESEKGSCNGNFLGIGADSCQRSILVEEAQTPGLLITNGEFVGRWQSDDSIGIDIAPGVTNKISLSNCGFWGPIDRCVWLRSDAAQLSILGSNFVQWDIGARGSAAVQLDAGKAILQGNTFQSGALPVRVDESVRSAILMGNQMPGGFYVENNAGERTQLIGNETDPIAWNDDRALHYVIDVGSPGDDRYLRHCHQRESALEWGKDGGTKRWTSGSTQLHLPVTPGQAYFIRMEAYIPPYALAPDAGLYIGDQRVTPIVSQGATTLTATFTAAENQNLLVLTLRCKAWRPREVLEGNNDSRSLGFAVRSVTVKARSAADDRYLNANTGMMVEPSDIGRTRPRFD